MTKGNHYWTDEGTEIFESILGSIFYVILPHCIAHRRWSIPWRKEAAGQWPVRKGAARNRSLDHTKVWQQQHMSSSGWLTACIIRWISQASWTDVGPEALIIFSIKWFQAPLLMPRWRRTDGIARASFPFMSFEIKWFQDVKLRHCRGPQLIP